MFDLSAYNESGAYVFNVYKSTTVHSASENDVPE